MAILDGHSRLPLGGGLRTESHVVKEPTKLAPEASKENYKGPKHNIAIGKFGNQSTYMNGIFSDGRDRLGDQAKAILTSSLQQTGRFSVLDRQNLEEIEKEAKLLDQPQKLRGARFAITGMVTEFGRKEVGDQQQFGVLGSGKTQSA